jgi:hypothetical protein
MPSVIYELNIGMTTYAQPAIIGLRSYIGGLNMSAAGSSSTFSIPAGVAADTTNATMMSLNSAYTKTTGAWAVGSGNGSLDVGTINNTTWYFPYLIQRSDTRVVDLLTSLAPNSSSTVTISIANPAVISWAAHGLQVGAPVVFSTTGSLPTGITAGTTYYVISAGLNSTTQFEISTSQGGSAVITTGSQSGTQTATSNPALPASYTNFRRIGALKTDGSSNWLGFTQFGDWFVWTTAIQDYTNQALTGSNAVDTLTIPSVPTGIQTFWQARMQGDNSSTAFGIDVYPFNTTRSANSTVIGGGVASPAVGGSQLSVLSDTCQRFKASATAASGTTFYVGTTGFIDYRGRHL